MLLVSVLLVATLAISFSTANEPTDRPDLCSSIHDLCVMLSAYPFQVCDSIAKACPSCSDSNGTFRKTYHCIEDTLAPKHNLSAMGNREFHPSACTAVQDICYFFKGPQSSTCPKMYTNCTEWSSNYRTLKEFGDCFDFDPDAPEVIDPDTKSINSCWRGNQTAAEVDVSCSSAVSDRFNECWRCTQLEYDVYDHCFHDIDRADDIDQFMSAIATAQICYNAAFNFGSLLDPPDIIGYSCEKAKKTCDAQMHHFNVTSQSEIDAAIYEYPEYIECQHQYDACFSCRAQENACRSGPWDGDLNNDTNEAASQSFCSAQASSCFRNAMTSNGTWEHPVNATNSDTAGHFTDYFTDYEDEGDSNNATAVTTAVVTVTSHA